MSFCANLRALLLSVLIFSFVFSFHKTEAASARSSSPLRVGVCIVGLGFLGGILLKKLIAPPSPAQFRSRTHRTLPSYESFILSRLATQFGPSVHLHTSNWDEFDSAQIKNLELNGNKSFYVVEAIGESEGETLVRRIIFSIDEAEPISQLEDLLSDFDQADPQEIRLKVYSNQQLDQSTDISLFDLRTAMEMKKALESHGQLQTAVRLQTISSSSVHNKKPLKKTLILQPYASADALLQVFKKKTTK